MENNECSICLEKIENKDKTVLSCKHVFHRDCIMKSIDYNNKCPYCRSFIEEIIFKTDEPYSIDKYLRVLENNNILFTGYRIESYKNKVLKIPLFIENGTKKEPIDLSIFLDFKDKISRENLNKFYSWSLSVINFLNKKPELVFYHNDNIFLLEIFYETLKKFSNEKDFEENYKIIFFSVLYSYYTTKKVVGDIKEIDLLSIRYDFVNYTGGDEKFSIYTNYQRKFFISNYEQ